MLTTLLCPGWRNIVLSGGLMATIAGGAGCGTGTSDAPVSEAAATTSSPTSSGSDAPAETSASAPASGVIPASAIAPADESPPQPMGPTRAEQAFTRLLGMGITVEQWEAAHQELIDLGADAADVLRQGLRSRDAMAREWAASILALNVEAAPLVAEELTACLTDGSGYVRANAAAALALVPDRQSAAIPVFLDLLQSADAELRRMAAVNLSQIGAPAADHLDRLTAALDDADPEIVRPLVELLGQLGAAARPALPRLQQMASASEDSSLKAAAARAVEQIESAN